MTMTKLRSILIATLILASCTTFCTGTLLVSAATTTTDREGESESESNSIVQPQPQPQPEDYQQRLVDWIRAGPNGYFHPSVVWQRLGPEGSKGTGPYAMHTLVDVKKGTPLLVVPRGYVLDSFQTYDTCTTVARMLEEYEQKQEDSLFAPYLSYLFEKKEGGTSNGLLPTSWTTTGKHILDQILDIENNTDDEEEDEDEDRDSNHNRDRDRYGRGLEPRYYEQPNVFEQCGPYFRGPLPNEALAVHDDTNDSKRQRVQDAFLFHVSRSWTDKMVPILDMYNHRNGRWLNVESTTAHDLSQDITAFAARDIQAGEQLQNSYSECMDEDCDYGEIKYTYLTPHILKDYGFVELYPRRWRLSGGGGGGDKGLIGEVDEDPMNPGKKTFQWIFDTPNQKNIEWLTQQLQRLQEMEEHVRTQIETHRHRRRTEEEERKSSRRRSSSDNNEENENNEDMRFNIAHEAETLVELYEGYVEVLQLAIEHQHDPVGLTYAEHRKEVQHAQQELKFMEEQEL